MNYFLILIIMGLCYGGYCEYSNLNQECDADEKKITDLASKADEFEAENKKLEDDKTELTKHVANDTAEITDLTKQVQDTRAALDEAKAKEEQMAKNPPLPDKPAAAQVTAPTGNNLGTIITLDGKSYPDCQLLKVKAAGIVVTNANGITELAFTMLSPDLQKRFGFDPQSETALTDAQVQYEEGQRQSAPPTP